MSFIQFWVNNHFASRILFALKNRLSSPLFYSSTFSSLPSLLDKVHWPNWVCWGCPNCYCFSISQLPSSMLCSASMQLLLSPFIGTFWLWKLFNLIFELVKPILWSSLCSGLSRFLLSWSFIDMIDCGIRCTATFGLLSCTLCTWWSLVHDAYTACGNSFDWWAA